ncbi:protein of unknown function [Streptomyces sp. KY75]|nr:protein of unknown function [Streptomyces sp. KY75]
MTFVSGVTSPIRRERLALFGVKFGPRRVLTVRSLCGMQTTGNREAPLCVSYRGLPDVLRMSLPQGWSVIRGDRISTAASRRSRLPEE